MILPPQIRIELEEHLRAAIGSDAAIDDIAPVAGGCISPAARIRTPRGDTWFVKWSAGDMPRGLFHAEAHALEALVACAAVRVPAVLGVRESWLLLEWLEPGRSGAATWTRLGAELAEMHRVQADAFGSAEDNFIGPLPQANAWSESWPEFWRAQRLQPQLARARSHFQSTELSRFDRLFDALDPILGPIQDEGPSMLHGDLWSGNVHIMADARAALIDPSLYYGHREVDLAMAALFGGIARACFNSYEENWPLRPGWAQRRAVYQLYYLLVHVNLFGSGYVPQTLAALREAGV